MGAKHYPSLSEKFLSLFPAEEDSNKCWHWKGSLTASGYGQFSFNKKKYSAHRMAYTLLVGPIPEGGGYHGTVVMHTCDNRLCVNPEHLILGSQRDNLEDMTAKGRRQQGDNHAGAKLTSAEVVQIRAAGLAGRTHQAIADEFLVSRGLVGFVLAGQIWKHV